MKKSELQNIIREVLNEENLLIPRRLDGRRELYLKQIRKQLQQNHIEGDLNLMGVKEITDLGNVETISGALILIGSNIKSLGHLTTVGKLWLPGSQIESLGNLTSAEAIYIGIDSKIPEPLMREYIKKFNIKY